MTSPASLCLVFTLADGDILNCRLATYDRQVAEYECCLAMRANPDRWVRIIEHSASTSPVGSHVWVGVVDGGSFSEIKVSVYDSAEKVQTGDPDWIEDLVIT